MDEGKPHPHTQLHVQTRGVGRGGVLALMVLIVLLMALREVPCLLLVVLVVGDKDEDEDDGGMGVRVVQGAIHDEDEGTAVVRSVALVNVTRSLSFDAVGDVMLGQDDNPFIQAVHRDGRAGPTCRSTRPIPSSTAWMIGEMVGVHHVDNTAATSGLSLAHHSVVSIANSTIFIVVDVVVV